MLTEKDYCGQNIKDLLAEVGFPIEDYEFCLQGPGVFIKVNVSLYEAQKWLREEKRICVEITCCAGGYVWELCKAYHKDWFSGGTTIYTHCCEDNAINPLLNDCGKYDSYESALLEGIKSAIKLLKEEK